MSWYELFEFKIWLMQIQIVGLLCTLNCFLPHAPQKHVPGKGLLPLLEDQRFFGGGSVERGLHFVCLGPRDTTTRREMERDVWRETAVILGVGYGLLWHPVPSMFLPTRMAPAPPRQSSPCIIADGINTTQISVGQLMGCIESIARWGMNLHRSRVTTCCLQDLISKLMPKSSPNWQNQMAYKHC